MEPCDTYARLDRHALVMAIWMPAGFVACILGHYGFSGAGAWWVFASFGAVAIGFACHVIANAVLHTDFTLREVAVALVVFGVGLLALGLCTLTIEDFAARFLIPVAAGMALLVAAAAFYMITKYGVRNAFDRFDAMRDFNPRPASRLPHRGGRR